MGPEQWEQDAAAARSRRLHKLASSCAPEGAAPPGAAPAAPLEEEEEEESEDGWEVLSPDRRVASRWVPDESATMCTGCGAHFSVLLRRHHCRSCGEVFCAACTAFRSRGADTGRSHRVCAACAGSSSSVGNASSVANATNDFAYAVADTAQFAAGSLVPRLGAAITAPIHGAAAGFEQGGGRGAANGFVEGLGRGSGGFLKGTIRTVGLATKSAVAAGRLGYHGASAIGSSIVNAAEDAKLGEATSELVAAPLRRQGGGARGFVTGVAEGVGGLAASAATTVGLTTKDLGEKTLAVTHRLVTTDDSQAAGNGVGSSEATAAASPLRSERFRPAFVAEEGAGLQVVAVYENQRRPLVLGGEFGPEHLFRFERGPESDADGEPKSRSDPTLLGDGWRWVGGWYVVWDEYKTDESGWSYNFNWPEPGEDRTSVLFQGWSAEASDRFGAQTWVRRRRWERLAAPVAKVSPSQQLPSLAVDSGNDSRAMGSETATGCGESPDSSPAGSPHRQNAAYVRTQLTPRERARRTQAEAEVDAEEADLHRSMKEFDGVMRDMQDAMSSDDVDGMLMQSHQPPEPEPDPHWLAAGIESTGKGIASGIMRSALSVGAAARYGQEMLVERTDCRDTGPLSKDTKEIVQLTADVSEDVLEASRVVSSGVYTVFKTLGKSAVAGAETITTAVMGQTATVDERPGSEQARTAGVGETTGSAAPVHSMDLAVEIGTAGVEAAIDIYHTFRRGVSLATSEVVGATAAVVEHRHGADAGQTARTVGHTVQNLGTAAFHTVSVYSAGVLDVAAEAATHIVGKDTWLEGDILCEGNLARESLFARGAVASKASLSRAGAGSGAGGRVEAARDEEPVGWWELRKNSLAVRVGGRRPSRDADKQSQLAQYELFVPLADVREIYLLSADGSRSTPSSSAETGRVPSTVGSNHDAAGPVEPTQSGPGPAWAWCVCSSCNAIVKYHAGSNPEQAHVACTTCGAALSRPAVSATQHQRLVAPSIAARASSSDVGVGGHGWQQELQVVIATVDSVRLCLRAETLSETKTWAAQLQRAVENNEERKRATWAVDMTPCCRPGARWMRDDEVAECLDCGANFTRWRRRHHCRNCGGLFCDDCSAWEHTVPGCGAARVRVCARCLAQLEGVVGK